MPIIEAREILDIMVAREFVKKGLLARPPQKLSGDAIVQVFSAIILDILMEGEPRPVLLDAAKRVVGNDSAAARALINSRKKIKTQDDPKGSKDLFFEMRGKI